MGGIGSGKKGGRNLVERSLRLNAGGVARAALLTPGAIGQWVWSRDGKQTATVKIRANANSLSLSYRWSGDGTQWQDADQTIEVVRTRCRLGGTRPYFICSGEGGNVCGRRAVHLYFSSKGRFVCRKCAGFAYASQREDAVYRAIGRVDKIRLRLGDDGSVPRRPKGMWRKTFDRLCKRLREAEAEAHETFLRGWSLRGSRTK